MSHFCPLPPNPDRVLLAHGGGGTRTWELLEQLVFPFLDNPWLAQRHDAAVVELPSPLAMTTDTYVVQPPFFPGGNIASLAVYGTVNDLLMAGARPRFLALGMILEEGLPLEQLQQVLISLREAAQRCGISVVTGDTKVVDQGHGDGLYLHTTGIGEVILPGIHPQAVVPGDRILLSGDVGRHGVAILAARGELVSAGSIESDCAPLLELILPLLEARVPLHCLRDLTRGGLAAALWEIARTAGVTLRIQEAAVPISEEVRGACDLLGYDPFHLASEGRCLLIVPPEAEAEVLRRLQGHPLGQGATAIGEVAETSSGQVLQVTPLGVERVMVPPSGELLPRIC